MLNAFAYYAKNYAGIIDSSLLLTYEQETAMQAACSLVWHSWPSIRLGFLVTSQGNGYLSDCVTKKPL